MSGSVVGNLTVRLDFDGSQFERGIAQAKRELSTYNKAVGMATRIAKDNNYAMGKSSDALHNMQQAYKGNAKMVETLTKRNEELKKSGSDTGQIEKNISHIRNHEMAMYDLEQEYKKFQKEMITANSAFTKFGKGAEATGKVMVNVGDGISQVGSGLTKAGLAVGGTLGVFTKQAIDFEQGLAGVQKTTNASSAEMEVLERDIRELAKTMPIATGELLALGEQAGQLGIPQERISGFTETMVMMGTATNLSAEEAGESFARFVNVTGHGLDDLDKLGSAVVYLGNNFATTESEIMNLAQGLAGSLSTVGVAEADILGLSAGMSALGINAERGSSSMSKFFINMAQDVSSGEGNLENFAKVSGVTAKEFQRAFEEDAMGAMEMFITGLGEMDDSGGDVIGTMEEMGITEIRLRDTILRLAKGHEVMSDALKTSNEGYAEGNALQEEYDILAETTASQLEIAKNKIKDLGLSMGQALLPAIIDIIDSSEGLVQSLEKGVNWFVNLDDATKETIVRFTAFALVGGPILNMFGNLISGGGNLLKGIGTMSKGVGKLEGLVGSKLAPSLFEASKMTGTFAKGATTAGGSKGIGALVKGVSIGLPVLKTLVGVGGVLALGYAGFKLWGEGAMEAKDRTQKWGANVDDETNEVLDNFQNLSAGVEEATTKMSKNVEEGGQQAIAGYEGMLASITKTVGEQVEEIEGFYGDLGSASQRILEGATKAQREELEQVQKDAERAYAEINEIYATAIEENRQLTRAEMKEVDKLHNKLAELQAEAIGGSAEQIRQTQKALMNDLQAMSEKQLLERNKLLQDDLTALKEHHDDVIEEIEDQHLRGNITAQEANKAKIAERRKHMREVQEIMDEEIKIMEARNLDEETMILELMDKYSEYGYTRQQIEQEIQAVLEGTQDKTKELDRLWERLMTDPVTGKVITNIDDVIMDMHQSEEDWAQLNYMVKEARLTTNVLEQVDQALIATGLWDDMDPEVKELLLENRVLLNKLRESEEAYNRWEAMEDSEKLILADNHDLALKIANSEELYTKWKELPEDTKHLLGDNEDVMLKILTSEEAYIRWDNLESEQKMLLADNEDLLTKLSVSDKEWQNFVDKGDETKDVKVEGTSTFNSQVEGARGTWRDFAGLKNITKTMTLKRNNITTNTTRYKTVGGPGSAQNRNAPMARRKLGTNFHEGGLAMVNDERTNRFRELITLPDGQQFIPEGKNVVLDLPRGSKVLRASLTQRMFPDLPQYADGVGLQTTRVPKAFNERESTTVDFSGIQRQINQLARILSGQQMPQAQPEGVTINIGTIENNTEHDIPRILEEASWIMRGEEKRLNG